MTRTSSQSRDPGFVDRLRSVLADRQAANLAQLCRSLVADPHAVRAGLDHLIRHDQVERLCPLYGERPEWVFYRWRRPAEADFAWQRALFQTDVHIRKEAAFRELSQQW